MEGPNVGVVDAYRQLKRKFPGSSASLNRSMAQMTLRMEDLRGSPEIHWNGL